MATYRYLAYDLLANTPLAELPLRDVQFEKVLNGAGTFYGVCPLGGSFTNNVTAGPTFVTADLSGFFVSATEPTRTALFIERNGVLVWGGIIWDRDYSGDIAGLKLYGQQLWSYFRHRRIRSTLLYDGVDQLTIAKGIIDDSQSYTGGNIGVTVPSVTSGRLRDREYFPYDLKETAEAVEQLAAVIDGFDFALNVAWSGSVPGKTLNFYYPRKGQSYQTTPLIAEVGKNVTHYTWPEQGSRMANTVVGVGAGEGLNMLMSTYVGMTTIQAGYPLLEDVLSQKDISVQSTLDEHVQEALKNHENPVVFPSITLKAALIDMEIGQFDVGDEFLFRVPAEVDLRFWSGLETFRRILRTTTYPGDEGEETVVLVVGEVY